MTCISSAYYGLGQFIIIELGVFFDLHANAVALFRGVQYHTGCAPRPTDPNYVIPAWAYRLLFVTYPKAAVYLALGRYILGSLRTVKNQVRRSAVRPRVVSDPSAILDTAK